MRARSGLRILIVAGIVLAGCNALIDIKDIHLDENAAGGQDAASDGAGNEGGNPGEGGLDGGPCMANLQTDPKHCGRCNHDCVGGACAAGRCEPVVLASGLGGPSSLALGATEIYVSVYTGNAVLAVAKDGSGARTLVSNQEESRGVAVLGSTLYWGNGDFEYDDAGRLGGIWQCTLPACDAPTRRIVATGDWATFPIPKGNFIYYGEVNGSVVSRAPIDGGPKTIIANTNHPFGLAIDDTHVYYTSNQPSLYRAKLDGTSVDGGNEEIVGAVNNNIGFVAVDATRVYWAYSEDNGKGHVQSVSKASPAAGSISYGSDTDNAFPVGVAVDDKNFYWSTAGTGTISTPTGDGKIFTCPKAGCGGVPPTLLATGNLFSGPMVVDDVAIYWLEFGASTQPNGRIRKVAKP